ncbi:MAG: AAA family ATPase [Hyphomicrobiales bacterium]|nr:AAA family ATPase [Hyphomicrobiales bacterium]
MMYIDHFGLKAPPFSIAPDPHYLYMSDSHREALAHLLYGVRHGGFVLLTGEIGAGKTTISRCLLSQLPETCDLAFIFNTKLTELELLATICDEFGIHPPAANDSIKAFVDLINAHMLEAHAAGRTCVLIIDEAQNLSVPLLELMRLLTNLETNDQKLLQIILIGQPELRETLKRPELRQLAQRITARYHLGPLTKQQTAEYITHRLRVAGKSGSLFERSAIRLVCSLSGGIPRVINVICDRALLATFVEDANTVSASSVKKAAREALGDPARAGAVRTISMAAAAGAFIVTGVVGLTIAVPHGLLHSLGWTETLRQVSSAAHVSGSPFAPSGQAQVEPSASLEERLGEDLSDGQTSVPGNGMDTTPTAVAAAAVTSAVASTDANPMTSSGPQAHAPDPELPLSIGLAAIPLQNAEDGPHEQSPLARPPVPTKPPPNERVRSWHDAFAVLYKLWGVDYQATQANACTDIVRGTLGCLHKTGDIEMLRQLNRPSVLTLVGGDGGQLQYAALIELLGDRAVLSIQGLPQSMPLEELRDRWTGEMRMLWRIPPGFTHALTYGDDDNVIVWVRERLAHVLAEGDASSASKVFDAPLLKNVKRFQAQNGMTQDGIIGPSFLIQLRTALDRSDPYPGDVAPAEG